MTENEISHEIIGAAIEAHRTLGPGLLEAIYEHALQFELRQRKLRVVGQVEVPVAYKGAKLGVAFRIDLLVEDLVIVEVKAVEHLLPVHKSQLLTYLKLADKRLGLLLNFNSTAIKNSIHRVVNNL